MSYSRGNYDWQDDYYEDDGYDSYEDERAPSEVEIDQPVLSFTSHSGMADIQSIPVLEVQPPSSSSVQTPSPAPEITLEQYEQGQMQPSSTQATLSVPKPRIVITKHAPTPPARLATPFTAGMIERGPTPAAARFASRTAQKQLQQLNSIEKRPCAIVAFLGHVDSGKSSICGSILRHIESDSLLSSSSRGFGADGHSLAFLLDSDPAERQRGVTIYARTRLISHNNVDIVLVDCPGHRDFVIEAFRGACMADAAVIVVDGSDGPAHVRMLAKEGQLYEHLAIAATLNLLDNSVVCVNKMDRVMTDRLEHVSAITGVLTNMLRHQHIKVIPTTADDHGTDENICSVQEEWGDTSLMEAISAMGRVQQYPEALSLTTPRVLLFAVEDSFGPGYEVIGRVISGIISLGLELHSNTTQQQVGKVLSIVSFGHDRPLAGPGDYVELRIAGKVKFIAGEIVSGQCEEPVERVKGIIKLTALFPMLARPMIPGMAVEICHCGEIVEAYIESIETESGTSILPLTVDTYRQYRKETPHITVRLTKRLPVMPAADDSPVAMSTMILRLEHRTLAFITVTEADNQQQRSDSTDFTEYL